MRQVLVTLIVIVGLSSGCGNGETHQPPFVPETQEVPPFPDAGTQHWPGQNDPLSSSTDAFLSSPSLNADAQSSSTNNSDGGTSQPPPPPPSCEQPQVQCSFACAPDQICTDAYNGACIAAQPLVGDASSSPLLAVLAKAYVDCWFSYPGKTKSCFTFDSCGMTGTVSGAMVESWICTTATQADLPGQYHADAQNILNCGSQHKPWGIKRPEWKVTDITPGKKGFVCLSYIYNGGLGKDRLHVKPCADSKP
jgi:hypothetical protein